MAQGLSRDCMKSSIVITVFSSFLLFARSVGRFMNRLDFRLSGAVPLHRLLSRGFSVSISEACFFFWALWVGFIWRSRVYTLGNSLVRPLIFRDFLFIFSSRFLYLNIFPPLLLPPPPYRRRLHFLGQYVRILFALFSCNELEFDGLFAVGSFLPCSVRVLCWCFVDYQPPLVSRHGSELIINTLDSIFFYEAIDTTPWELAILSFFAFLWVGTWIAPLTIHKAGG